MTTELVTVVRFRTLIEEVVLPRAEFEQINTSHAPADEADLSDYEVRYRIDELPFKDWQWGEEYFVDFPAYGYMAFAGDVTGETDDLVLCSDWQDFFPLTVDEMEMPTIEQIKAKSR